MISAYRSGKSYVKNLLLSLAIVLCLAVILSQTGWINQNSIILAILCALIGHTLASFTHQTENVAASEGGDISAQRLTLYVGNLLYRTRKEDLVDLFSQFGEVHSARIILDKDSKKPAGYGFVELDAEVAEKAVNDLNGSQFQGRLLKVSEAKRSS